VLAINGRKHCGILLAVFKKEQNKFLNQTRLLNSDCISMAAPDFAKHFSVENIPFGIATGKAHSAPQCVTRVENAVIFLDDILREGLFDVVEIPDNVFQQDSLNSFAVLPKNVIRDVRKIIQTVVALKRVPDHAMEQITNVRMQLPFTIGDFIGK